MKPYQPDTLPLADLDHKRLFALVGDANAELARYDALLQTTVNSAILLSPLTNEEAVLSSRIEGTQATVDEVLEQEAGMVKEGDKYEDIQEIINYREALRQGRDYLRERPITLAFVRELHRVLMSSVRGKDKNLGEFRKDQNWIGKAGCTLAQATFVPPSPLAMCSIICKPGRLMSRRKISMRWCKRQWYTHNLNCCIRSRMAMVVLVGS